MSKELTTKQQAVLLKLAEYNGDWRPAIMEVYRYTPETKGLNQKVWSVKNKIRSKTAVQEFLAVHGIDMNLFASKLSELLNAKKVKYSGGEMYEEPDNGTQMSALSLLADVMGIKQKQTSREIVRESRQLIVVSESVDDALRTAEQKKEKYGIEMTDPNYTVEDVDVDAE